MMLLMMMSLNIVYGVGRHEVFGSFCSYLPHTLHAYSGRGPPSTNGCGIGAGTYGLRRLTTTGSPSCVVVVVGFRLFLGSLGFIKLNKI
jgi:hypothetical protein